MLSSVRVLVAGVVASCMLMLSVGCGTANTHPNEISAFDGSTFDTLVATEAVLTSLRSEIASTYPTYKDVFDTAAVGFNTTVTAYGSFRVSPNAQSQAQLSTEVLSLTQAIVALENQIQVDLKVSPAQVAAIRAKATKTKHSFLKAHATADLTLTDILTELEVAAGVAEAIPVAAPYAALAQVVIEATQVAVNAVQSANGTPIDLTKLPAIALL